MQSPLIQFFCITAVKYNKCYQYLTYHMSSHSDDCKVFVKNVSQSFIMPQFLSQSKQV
jgi:hypothetical protein